MSDIREFVIFKLKGEHYGIDISNVENIEKLIEITRVPYTQDFIVGVVNLRGIIIPVVDLRKRFGLEAQDNDDETRIIIVHVKDTKIGMIVDASSEVLQLEVGDIDLAPSVKGSYNEEFITHVGKSNGRIIMLVDLEKVLGLEDLDEE